MNGKRGSASFGSYPAVSLAQARQKFIAAKWKTEKGFAQEHDGLFDDIAREWFNNEVAAGRWKTPRGQQKKLARLEKHLLSAIGHMPIENVEAKNVFDALSKIPGTGDTMHRAANNAVEIFAYAIARGYCHTNAALSIKAALRTQDAATPMRGLVEREDLGELLKRIEVADIGDIYRIALLLHAHTALRNTELRGAEWCEIDVDEKVWVVPAERMKLPANGDHWVPLTKQTVTLLKKLRKITGDSRFLFPARNRRKVPYMCDRVCNTQLTSIWPEGVKTNGKRKNLTVHGFRETLSTLANDERRFDKDIIEAQLHHVDPDTIRRKYNRAQYREHRRELLDWYSGELSKL